MFRLPLITFWIAALIVAGGGVAFAQQSVYKVRTTHFGVDVKVYKDYSDNLVLDEIASTIDSNHSVRCFSAMRDVKYELYNSVGRLVTQDRSHPSGEYIFGNAFGPDPGDLKGPCKDFTSQQAQSRILLSAIYWNLPRGSYTLYVTLSPRWSSEAARSQAIPINI